MQQQQQQQQQQQLQQQQQQQGAGGAGTGGGQDPFSLDDLNFDPSAIIGDAETADLNVSYRLPTFDY